MKVTIATEYCPNGIEAGLREQLEGWVQRFGDRIADVQAHLADESSMDGGDQVCTIDVKISPRGLLHVRAKHADLYSAVLNAIRGAENMILHAMGTPLGSQEQQSTLQRLSCDGLQEAGNPITSSPPIALQGR